MKRKNRIESGSSAMMQKLGTRTGDKVRRSFLNFAAPREGLREQTGIVEQLRTGKFGVAFTNSKNERTGKSVILSGEWYLDDKS